LASTIRIALSQGDACAGVELFWPGRAVLSTLRAVKPVLSDDAGVALLPMVALATMRIASQALISGAFSATKQIAQLATRCASRYRHTSVK
jgi:KUP system potassium uptake protein